MFIRYAYMKRLIYLLALALVSCSTADERAAKELAERIVPGYADNIIFCQSEDSCDVFELKSDSDRLFITGNNANSMAMGLNYFLKNYCDVTVSWYASEPVQYPSEMPVVDMPVRIECRVRDRFFLNYCTYGYTMAWWKWEDWERFIDWMALNGVNMPLANTGQEAVWQKVWRRHGLSDDQIRAYFTAPAQLAWHRMSNIDHYGGPLPQNWIDEQAKLQKQILKRERQLNMRPVLGAFSGHVPEQLKEIYPDAAITDINSWAGFPKENLCCFLSPTDPLYANIQKEFMIEQEKMFGTDHIYGVDLFNEIDPPTWEPETLAEISKSAYESMADADPDAIWLQMGWMFYHDRKHWTPDIIEAYLKAVPQGKVIILDYYLDRIPVWERTESFYGQPYILCYLGNFGGNVWMTGDYHLCSERLDKALDNGGDNMTGVGATLEGFGVNMFMYEMLLDKAWKSDSDDSRWAESFADRTLGREDQTVRDVFKVLTDSIYVDRSTSSQTPLACSRPSLEGYWYWTAQYKIKYDNDLLVELWRNLLKVHSDRNSYRSFVVTVGVQALGNHFIVMRDALAQAYYDKDAAKLEEAGKVIMDAFEDLDALAACDPMLRLDKWIEDASAWGSTPEESSYYRQNAREIITTWASPSDLQDYATRLWSGLLESYYAPRWKMFIEELQSCVAEGREYDQNVFYERLGEVEREWAAGDGYVETQPAGDYMELSHKILNKYF